MGRALCHPTPPGASSLPSLSMCSFRLFSNRSTSMCSFRLFSDSPSWLERNKDFLHGALSIKTETFLCTYVICRCLLYCNAVVFSSEADLHMTKWKVESKLQTQFWTFCTFLSKELEMLLCVTDTRGACMDRRISVIFHLYFLLSPFHNFIVHFAFINIKWPHFLRKTYPCCNFHSGSKV